MPRRAIIQVAIDRDGLLPEDVVTNTWHFEGDDTDTFDGLLPGLMNRIKTFYQAISLNFAGTCAGSFTIKAYDWSDAKPRVPKAVETWTMVPSSNSLPGECAACLSYSATPVSGQKNASKRGRVFLGPLNSQIANAQGADVRLDPSTTADILPKAITMATGAGGAFRLAVFSPTILARGGTADDAWSDATSMWMDNALDTVRSRGARPTVRDTLPIAP